MTSQDIKTLSSTSKTSGGGSRTAILLEKTVIKFPSDLTKLDIEELDIKELFEAVKYESCRPNKTFCENDVGVEQMLAEWDVWEKCPKEFRHLLCPILEKGFMDTGVPYSVMARARTFCNWGDDEDFFDLLSNELDYSQEEIDVLTGEISELCRTVDISEDDIITNCSNIGVLNGRLVIIDYGWCHNWIDSDEV